MEKFRRARPLKIQTSPTPCTPFRSRRLDWVGSRYSGVCRKATSRLPFDRLCRNVLLEFCNSKFTLNNRATSKFSKLKLDLKILWICEIQLEKLGHERGGSLEIVDFVI